MSKIEKQSNQVIGFILLNLVYGFFAAVMALAESLMR